MGPILIPHSLPSFRDDGEIRSGGAGGKRKREKERMDKRKTKRPEAPLNGPGRGGRVGASATQHIVQHLVRDSTRDEDVSILWLLSSRDWIFDHPRPRVQNGVMSLVTAVELRVSMCGSLCYLRGQESWATAQKYVSSGTWRCLGFTMIQIRGPDVADTAALLFPTHSPAKHYSSMQTQNRIHCGQKVRCRRWGPLCYSLVWV